MGRTSSVRRGLVAFPFAVVLLAAPAGALPAYKDTDACDLLKRSEIEDAVDREAGKPEELGVGDSSCFWELSGLDGGGMVVTVYRGRQAKATYHEGKEVYGASDIIAIADLGKEAFSTPTGEVWVLKNKKTVFFVTGEFDPVPNEALARIVLDRL